MGRLVAALACLLSLLAVQLIGAIPAAAAEGPPAIDSVSPTGGSPAGGTTVTILGQGFAGASAVRFGDTEAASFTVTNREDEEGGGDPPDKITVVSPPYAAGSSVHVTVVTPRGTSPTSDCGDSSEIKTPNTFPRCDRFYYFGEPRGGAWASTGLQKSDGGGQATLLLSGKVLLTGGGDTDTALYDPAKGSWSSCPEATASPSCPGPLTSELFNPTATLLKDGRVLAVYGTTSELYDPATGKWSKTGDLRVSRFGHAATPLADGRVLVTGGAVPGYANPDGTSAEIYNPATGQWKDTKPMVEGNREHTAVLLGSGKVLVAGGRLGPNPALITGTDTSQLYDPALDAWTSCPVETAATAVCPGPLVQGRYENSATVLSDGRVLVAGGGTSDQVLTYSTAELYDPQRGIWTLTGRLGQARNGAVAARLANGKVLVAGGFSRRDAYYQGEGLRSAELYDPVSGRWSQAPFMPDANASTGVALPSGPWAACGANCGKVLVVRVERDGFTFRPNAPSLLFSPTPEVARVTPTTAASSGGTPVTITGTGLASARSVEFGGVEAERIEPDGANPDAKLTAIAPAHAPGSVAVTVTTDGGGSAATPAARLTYVQSSGSGSGSGSGSLPTDLTTPGRPQGGRPAPVAPPSLSERAALQRCLAKAASQRTRSRRRRAKRRCLMPGRVGGLTARAMSASKIALGFSVPGSVALGRFGAPPAGRYIVKQSRRPINSERAFRRALTLCRGACRFGPTRVGQRLRLTVTDLRPRTTYYYSVKAVGSFGHAGPRSHAAKTRTHSRSRR